MGNGKTNLNSETFGKDDASIKEAGKALLVDKPGAGDLLQQNTFENLANLGFVPKMTVAELIHFTGENGVGVGTLMNDKGKVVGEVTVMDGKAYVSEINFDNTKGNTREAKPDEMVYFAQVGHFEPELQKFKLTKDDDFVKNHPKYEGKLTKEILEDYIREVVLQNDPEKIGAFVVKITDAKFDHIKLRSVDGGQEYQFGGELRKPKNLNEVISKQVEKTFGINEEFRVAGLYNNMDDGSVSTSESPEGLHIHAISKDNKFGGHVQVQDIDLNSCEIQVMPIQRWLVSTRDHADELQFRKAEHPETTIEIEKVRQMVKQFTSAGYGISK